MNESPPAAPVCYRHTSRETWVRCARCDRHICPDCMSEAAVGHQCPECVAEGRRTQRPVRTAFGGGAAGQHGFVTKALIGINVAVALLALGVGGLGSIAGGRWGGLLGGATALHQYAAMIGYIDVPGGQLLPFGVVAGEYYRLFTAMFLHYGVLHLALNMWALWIIGRTLEGALGPARFLALYLVSGLGGSVAVYYFAPTGLTAGASGAIFGLFAALFVILRRLGRDTSGVVPILVINLVFTFTVPGISIAGHLGGMAIGAATAAILAYAPRHRRTMVQAVGSGLLVVALIGLAVLRTTMLVG
ncbi:MAG TPA: rhomboid family intramembrane serine protease [Micromonosporaceae bacterium]|nr:rhomboid family intramembrane serine protease [Micromonosporaceae bacterium]